jgi:hypothetical protein
VAAELSRALPGVSRRYRLLGVQATGLVPAGAQQLALLRADRWGDMERTVDRIERRFGRGATTQASLMDRDRRPRSPAGTDITGRVGFRPTDERPYNRA